MDDDIKKNTILNRLQRKFEASQEKEDTVIVRVFLEDFPSEIEMSFKEIGLLMKELGREGHKIKIESVDNMSTDPDFYLQQSSIPVSQLMMNKAFYRVQYTGKVVSLENVKTPKVILEKGTVYLQLSGIKKIRVGKAESRQAKLLNAFKDDKDELSITRNTESLFEYIKIKKDEKIKRTNDEWKQVVKDTQADINKSIHKKTTKFTISVKYENNIAKLKITDEKL